MNRFTVSLCAVVLLVAGSFAQATLVDVDYALAALDGNVFNGDLFNDDVILDWIVAGTPTEAGEYLSMGPGDQVARVLNPITQGTLKVEAAALLTDFPSDATLSLILFDQGGDHLFLTLTPASATLAGALTGVINTVPLAPGAAAMMSIEWQLGNTLAEVNGTEVSDGPGSTSFVPTGYGILVTPEPASAMLVLLGAGCLLRRRR